jgi:hypothetical protein
LLPVFEAFNERHYFQSETCSLIIPELELEMGSHAIGGKFTTLEGLLRNVLEQIDQVPGDPTKNDFPNFMYTHLSDFLKIYICKKFQILIRIFENRATKPGAKPTIASYNPTRSLVRYEK